MNPTARGVRQGFTLIELLVSVIIIGIVVAMVAPQVGKSMSATRVNRASSVIAADIQRAFSLAAQKRSPVRISVDTAGKTMYLWNRARDTIYVKKIYDSKSDIGLTRLEASDTTIVIFPNGLASGAFNITVNATAANRRRISATRAGQIRITTP
ncbi:MAG: prepilin-type N-terminal cleavage/methylation domain-containing protein [Longimicrobiales bacterium]